MEFVIVLASLLVPSGARTVSCAEAMLQGHPLPAD